MTSLIATFIKHVAVVIIIFLLFVTVFTEYGIPQNSLAYLSYAEPIIHQIYIAQSLTTGSYSPGTFTSTISTSGAAMVIEIYKFTNVVYVSVTPQPNTFSNVQFSGIEPTPVITSCTVNPTVITVSQTLGQTILIKKVDTSTSCQLSVEVV